MGEFTVSSAEAVEIAYCTIASANYLGKVQALLQSLEKVEPNREVFVLLCEAPSVCEQLSAETGVRFLSPEDVCSDWKQMAFYYNVLEFNTALKPFLLSKLLGRGFRGVVYFDPDIEVYEDLGPIREAMARHDIVLTPHVCVPIPNDGFKPNMADCIRAGQFNLGFVGVSNTEQGRAALAWWQSVCIDRCLFDPSHRYFVDQFWAAAFPSLVDRCGAIRHPGCNVAYWNIFQRELTQIGGRWKVDGQPLLFFHFSGLDADDVTAVSRYQNRVIAPVGGDLHRLLSGYLSTCARMTWNKFTNVPYSFSRYSDGTPISARDRRAYLYLSYEDRNELEDPFSQKANIRKIICLRASDGFEAHRTRNQLQRYWHAGRSIAGKLRLLLKSLARSILLKT